MRALTKLCSLLSKFTVMFFCITLPQAIRFTILTLHVLWIKYKRARAEYNYTSSIDNKSSKFVYRRQLSPDSQHCSICLSDFVEGEKGREIVECKHVFHQNCIEKWLQEGHQATCPLCRHLLVPKEIVAELQRVLLKQDDDTSEVELARFFLSALHTRNCLS